VSAPLLEYAVFSKMHFDRQGFIVATRDDIPVGFVHAGFGPNEDGTTLDRSMGTTHMLMLRGGIDDNPLVDELLAASENYLRSSGAKTIYAGGIKPLNSFYLGLYGGSEIPGVLQSNRLLREACLRSGYTECGQVSILQCDLVRFRPPMSRKARQIGRHVRVEETIDPIAKSWWEACVWGSQQRDRFRLIDRRDNREIAAASFWDVQPLSACWGICTAGLFDLHVDPEWRRQGAATHLLAESFRLLRRRGVATIEAQTMTTNEAAIAFYHNLGFVEVDHGHVFRKNATTFTPTKRPTASKVGASK